MIMKFCPKCKKLHSIDSTCPNSCKKSNSQENKLYDKFFRKNKDIYSSSRWEKIRKRCLNKYDNICIYTLYKYNKILPATLVHHIIALEEDKSKAFDIDNLIPVSDLAHREIHKRYRDENIKEVQKELHKYIRLYTINYLEV